MQNLYSALKADNLGVVEGRFRSLYCVSDLIEQSFWQADDSQICFEISGKIICILKTNQRKVSRPDKIGGSMLEFCLTDGESIGAIATVQLYFKNSHNYGNFIAWIDESVNVKAFTTSANL